MNKAHHAPPRANALIEALRGLGYSMATALADIIDNSIAACADTVKVQFSWKGASSTITVFDNGEGMDRAALHRAMRLGETSPLDIRPAHDLGRFGLGLKTASFSQCRRLTVASVKNRTLNCLRWDLDVVAASVDDGWYLLEGPQEGSESLLEPVTSGASGTLVLWEVLDRVVTAGYQEQDFLDAMDKVEQHLALVFHRFLQRPSPRLRLFINERLVTPVDPFLLNHPATWTSQTVKLASEGGVIEIQCHVLPHKDRLNAREHDIAAGPDGWTAQQGFYVYRNKRLLVAGSWLGLGQGRTWTKEEAHRLARIRLDIPNTADTDWKIDVRKSTARPPVMVRLRLTRLAEDTRKRARRVFAHRGRVAGLGDKQPFTEAWRTEHFNGGVRYRIDENHIAVKAALEEAGDHSEAIRAMLRVLEETIPVQRIWLDTTEAHETPRTGFAEAPPAEVSAVLSVMYRSLIHRRGVSSLLAREQLLQTDPFQNYPELVRALPDEPATRQ